MLWNDHCNYFNNVLKQMRGFVGCLLILFFWLILSVGINVWNTFLNWFCSRLNVPNTWRKLLKSWLSIFICKLYPQRPLGTSLVFVCLFVFCQYSRFGEFAQQYNRILIAVTIATLWVLYNACALPFFHQHFKADFTQSYFWSVSSGYIWADGSNFVRINFCAMWFKSVSFSDV